MTARQAIILSLTLISMTLALLAFDTAAAEPPALAPTEEPTKRPYVFPTPIFIPTYPTEAPVVATAAPTGSSAGTQATGSPKLTGSSSYTVQPNDNPWTIAQKLCGNGTKWSSIMTENSIADATKLRVGTVLKVPADCSGGASIQATAPTTPAPLLPVPTPALVSQSVPISIPLTSPRGTNTSSLTGGANLVWQIGMLAVNIGSGLLLLGAVASGTSAWLVYRRTRFLRAITYGVHRLRARHR